MSAKFECPQYKFEVSLQPYYDRCERCRQRWSPFRKARGASSSGNERGRLWAAAYLPVRTSTANTLPHPVLGAREADDITHRTQPDCRIVGVDVGLESPETATLHLEEAAARANAGDFRGDDPPCLLPMSAYGKPQPSQLHGKALPTRYLEF